MPAWPRSDSGAAHSGEPDRSADGRGEREHVDRRVRQLGTGARPRAGAHAQVDLDAALLVVDVEGDLGSGEVEAARADLQGASVRGECPGARQAAIAKGHDRAVGPDEVADGEARRRPRAPRCVIMKRAIRRSLRIEARDEVPVLGGARAPPRSSRRGRRARARPRARRARRPRGPPSEAAGAALMRSLRRGRRPDASVRARAAAARPRARSRRRGAGARRPGRRRTPWNAKETSVQRATITRPRSGRPASAPTLRKIRFGLRRAVMVRNSESIGRQQCDSILKASRKRPSSRRPAK